MPVLKVRDPTTGNYVPLLGSGTTDHGALTGLGDDDHTQYLLASGTRAMGGTLHLGGHLIDGVASPGASDHAVNKGYVDANMVNGSIGASGGSVHLPYIQLIRANAVTNASGQATIPFISPLVGAYRFHSVTMEAAFNWVFRVSAVSDYNLTVIVFNPANLTPINAGGVTLNVMVAGA